MSDHQDSSTELTIRLHELCELLHISVHRPRMTYRIKDSKVNVGKHTLDSKQATAPAWKLMPAEMSAELDRIDNAVSRLLDQYTQRFRTGAPGADEDSEGTLGAMIRGLYLVPQKHVETLLRELRGQHDAMRACVRHWVSDTTQFQNAVKSKMGDDALYDLVKENIPTLGTMLQSARIDVTSIPFGMSMGQLRQAGQNSFLQEARARTGEMVAQVTRQLISGPRRELADAIDGLKTLIEANGRVSTKSVAPIRRALDKLKMFDFVADQALLDQMANMETTLSGITPSEQNLETSTNNGLLAVLRQTAATALDEARIEDQYKVATSRLVRLRKPAGVT